MRNSTMNFTSRILGRTRRLSSSAGTRVRDATIGFHGGSAATNTTSICRWSSPLSCTSSSSGRLLVVSYEGGQRGNRSSSSSNSSRMFSSDSYPTNKKFYDPDEIDDPFSVEHPGVKTFATENPHLKDPKEDLKVFFEDFEPGEEIPISPLPPFDDGSGKVIASPELKALTDRICSLSMIEIHQLCQLIDDHLGVDDSDFMTMGGGGGGGGGGGASAEAAAPVEKKTAFDVKLVSFDAKSKIKVIKEIRGIADMGLKEAKELVEGAPKIFKKGIKQEEADEIKAKLEALGAVIEIE